MTPVADSFASFLVRNRSYKSTDSRLAGLKTQEPRNYQLLSIDNGHSNLLSGIHGKSEEWPSPNRLDTNLKRFGLPKFLADSAINWPY